MKWIFVLIATAISVCHAQPVINSVVNATGYQKTLAPGAVFVIFGSAMGLFLSANLFPPSVSYYFRIPRSSSKSTVFRFDRSPMSLRRGSGSHLMSVGTATICSSLARFGCW